MEENREAIEHNVIITGRGRLEMPGIEDVFSFDEIQIIANLMKAEWLARTIATWENVKVMYDERDFSQANLLDKFIKLH